MPLELVLEERSLSSAYMEGDCHWSPDNVEEADRSCVADKRTPLRHMCLSQTVNDSECVDEAGDTRKLKRRQMKKDLHKLKRCMARTGVAVVAASMLGSPIDGVASMDQASRFRRQHRRPIPELSPELYTDDEPGFEAFDYTDITTSLKEAEPLRSYRLRLLDAGSSKDLSSNTAPGLTMTEWDRVSEMSEIGSEAGCPDCDPISIVGSDILFDQENRHEADAHCTVEEGHLDFVSCLDSVSRFRRPGKTKHSGWPHRRQVFKPNNGAGAGVFAFTDETESDNQVDALDSVSFKTGFRAATPGLLTMAKSVSERTVAHCKDAVSKFTSLLGEAPQHVAGNFASPSDVRLATQRAIAGDAEERHHAKIFLLCALGFLVFIMLSCVTLALIVLAFAATPDGTVQGKEPKVNDTGLIDANGRPKSISRVLTVVMISLFAGNGLAISHPMRDAILAGI